MARYSLSSRADADLAGIADYSIEAFGFEQARRYGEGLEECLNRLADQPKLGNVVGELRPALRRFQWKSHVVFYVPDEHGVFIVRVLHESMDWRRHL